MKKFFCLLTFLFLPLMISAQNINGSISSSLYSFERFNSTEISETFIRSYSGLNLNFNYDNISVRTRVNLETNLGKSLDDDPRLRFYNLYFEARNIFDLVTLKVGRQPLFTPIAGGLYDGVNLKFKYSDYALTGFYGGNVPAYQKLEFTDDLGNDYVLGGKFETTALEDFRFAVSYIDKNFKSVDYNTLRLDEELDPITALIQTKSNQYKFLSGEVQYSYDNIVDVNTRYEFDVNYKETSKIEFDTRVNATEDLGISGYYNYRAPKIRYNSIFSVFDYGTTQEIEGGIDYKVAGCATLIGKFGYVSYKDESSTRFTIGANTSYGSITYRKNLGYAGELDAVSLFAARSYFDGLITPSVGIAFTSYKLSKDTEQNNITSLIGGCNVRPSRTLSFDLQGQYFNNKIYQNDFRILFKVNYLFNTNL